MMGWTYAEVRALDAEVYDVLVTELAKPQT